jgi:hypothetical protein
MRFKSLGAALAASILASSPLFAQATTLVKVEGSNPAPVPQQPPVEMNDDSPEDIAKDAARDLKDSRFYNKPGATRAQYDADWQRCRLIARGSRTPGGTVPVYYNPAIISPAAAGAGGLLGGLIANAIIQGQQRRANRRQCLLINGWRLVEPPSAEAAKVAEMTDEQRDVYFNTIVGAEKVGGEITERKSFALAPDPALKLDAPVSGPSSLFLGKKVEAATKVTTGPEEGVVVLAFRRPDEGSAGRSGAIQLARYDMETRDLMHQPRGAKKKGDLTTYGYLSHSADKKAPYEVHVLKLTAGDYVITGTGVGKAPITTSTASVRRPSASRRAKWTYLGDFIPFMDVKLADGEEMNGLAHTMHIEDARKALAVGQPALASALQPATLRNGATYACAAINMDRWDVPGAPMLEPVAATVPEAASGTR